jgi:3-hydroxyisobutyrate dehydrogenase-like beta-hydroxyacid dehydrogenase
LHIRRGKYGITRTKGQALTIGMAGTGRMGAAIAQRLIGLGHQVTVWNRTAAKAQALGVTLPVTARALECFDQASREGLGAADGMRLPARWAKDGGKAKS